MKLLIARHGDPDYAHDSLTEVGRIEAELLADRLCAVPADRYYVSPLGRAQETAAPTLTRLGRSAETHAWLREFDPLIRRPDRDLPGISWDWLPEDWTADPRHYDKDAWCTTEIMREGGVPEKAAEVYAGIDALLAENGYVRERGGYYRAAAANEKTLVFFCHFGVECVILGHLLGVSPMVLWHGFCAAPTSVTTVITEERRPGNACFRVNSFGDVSHLTSAGREPSFSARFCETYANFDQRHD